MKKWYVLIVVSLLIFVISGCNSSTDQEKFPINDKVADPTVDETEAAISELDSIEYWDIVQEEIISMLNKNNLYTSGITHGYPCVQFYVEPGIVTDDGKIVATGLSQAEYAELFECVKVELHIILDKYKLAKPKTAFHGCHSLVEIFFNNWFVDENKIYDNVDSRWVASYGVDLLEYYYDYQDDTYVKREGFSTDVWSKYPIYTP